MNINTLELHNYKQFRNAKFEFCNKLNIVVGKGGTGKTVLCEAMLWTFGMEDYDKTGGCYNRNHTLLPFCQDSSFLFNTEGLMVQGIATFEMNGIKYQITRKHEYINTKEGIVLKNDNLVLLDLDSGEVIDCCYSRKSPMIYYCSSEFFKRLFRNKEIRKIDDVCHSLVDEIVFNENKILKYDVLFQDLIRFINKRCVMYDIEIVNMFLSDLKKFDKAIRNKEEIEYKETILQVKEYFGELIKKYTYGQYWQNINDNNLLGQSTGDITIILYLLFLSCVKHINKQGEHPILLFDGIKLDLDLEKRKIFDTSILELEGQVIVMEYPCSNDEMCYDFDRIIELDYDEESDIHSVVPKVIKTIN